MHTQAIQGAGGSDTRVGRFLSNLFGAAAGDDQQTLFQVGPKTSLSTCTQASSIASTHCSNCTGIPPR